MSYKAGDLAKYFAKKTKEEKQTEGGKRFAELLSKGTLGKTSPEKVHKKQKLFSGSKKRKKEFNSEEKDSRETKKFKGPRIALATEQKEVPNNPVPYSSKKNMKKFQKSSQIQTSDFKKMGNFNYGKKKNVLSDQSKASSGQETSGSEPLTNQKWKNKKKPFNQNMAGNLHRNTENVDNEASKNDNVNGSGKKKKKNKEKKKLMAGHGTSEGEVTENDVKSYVSHSFPGEADASLTSKKKKNKKRNKILNEGASSIRYDPEVADTFENVETTVKPDKASKKHKKRKQSEVDMKLEHGPPTKTSKKESLGNPAVSDTSPGISKKKKRKKNKQEIHDDNDDDEEEIISELKDILDSSRSHLTSKKNNKKGNQSFAFEQLPNRLSKEDELDNANQQFSKMKKDSKKWKKDEKKGQKQQLLSFGTKKKHWKSDIPGLAVEPKLMKFSSKGGNPDSVDGGVENGSSAEDEPVDDKQSKLDRSKDAEKDKRTLFFGNIPLGMDKDDVKKIFKNYGSVESIRFRSFIPLKDKTPRKFAERRKECSENVTSLKGYVVFKTKEDAESGIQLNGTVVNGNHIRVDWAVNQTQKQHKGNQQKTVFIGNLSYNIQDESVWSKFSDCGDIVYARVIRDSTTGVGKGFGFVEFKEASSVSKALELNETDLDGREIRVKLISDKNAGEGRFKQEGHKKKFGPKYKKKNPLGVSENSHKSMKKVIHKKKREREKKRVASVFKPFYDSLSTASKLKTAKGSF